MSNVSPGWFACEIDRKVLKSLMRRNDATGLSWFGAWLAGLVATGVLAYLSLGTPWVVPAFALYGGVVEAYREMIDTFLKQQKDPSHVVRPQLETGSPA